jgi:hypothetical protein
MSKKKLYGKIYHEEGVVTEVEFTHAIAAKWWAKGAQDALEAVDSDDLSVCVDDEPSKEGP